MTYTNLPEYLIPASEAREVFTRFQPVTPIQLTTSDEITFKFEEDWRVGLKDLGDDDFIHAHISVNGSEYRLTKNAAFTLGVSQHLSASFAQTIPPTLLSSLLNFLYKDLGDTVWHLLVSNGAAIGLVKASFYILPTYRLFDEVLEHLSVEYGTDEIYVDSRHLVSSTILDSVRFVVPSETFGIANTSLADITFPDKDVWYRGLLLENSLIGKQKTGVSLFALREADGSGVVLPSPSGLGFFDRREYRGDGSAVYSWLSDILKNTLFKDWEFQEDKLNSLKRINVTAAITDVITDIADSYGVPTKVQPDVLNFLLRQDITTLYTILVAIAASAELEGLAPKLVTQVQRIAGFLLLKTFDTRNAEIWRQGNEAPQGSENPWELKELEID